MRNEYLLNELKKEYDEYISHLIIWFIGSGIFAGCMFYYKFNRKFYEQDPELSYYSTNSDIVSDTNLYLMNIIPVCVILIMAFTLTKTKHNLLQFKTTEIAIIILAYFLTIGINIFITEILKKIISKPRPSVFYLCNYQGYRDGIKSNNLTEYYSLTSPHNLANLDLCLDKSALPNAISSFPSGHTSLSFCSQTFLVIILIWIFKNYNKSIYYKIHILSKLNYLAFTPYILSGWIAISRIYDYKHNEVDLIGGFIIGCGVGYFSSIKIINIYSKLEIIKNISDQNISDQNISDQNISEQNISNQNIGEQNISDQNISNQNNKV